MGATLADITSMTNVDSATRVIADAANEMRDLEARGERVFAHWLTAQAVADEAGIAVDLKMSDGMAAWLADVKAKMRKRDAKLTVAEEFGHSVRA